MKESSGEIHWGQAHPCHQQAECIYAIQHLLAVDQMIWQMGRGHVYVRNRLRVCQLPFAIGSSPYM